MNVYIFIECFLWLCEYNKELSLRVLHLWWFLAYSYNPVVTWVSGGPVWGPAATLPAPSPARTWRQSVVLASPPWCHTSTCFPERSWVHTPSLSSLCPLCRWKWPLIPLQPTFKYINMMKLQSWQQAWRHSDTQLFSPSPNNVWNITTSYSQSPK